MKTVLAVIALCSLGVGQAAYSGSGSYSGSAVYSLGATITAASCSASDVQAALNSINQDSTVIIPAGNCTWTTSVFYTQSSYNVAILGQSSPTGYNAQGSPTGFTDSTNITDGLTHSGSCSMTNSSTNDCVLGITTANGKLFRLSGLTFTAGASHANQAVVVILGTSQAVRVDHNHFVQNGTAQLETNGDHLFGVIDHNLFEMAGAHQGIWFWQTTWNGHVEGDGSWTDPPNFGSSQFMFAENNTFNGVAYGNQGSGADDCTRGGRYVFRYNTLSVSQAVQTHPTGGSGRARGCRASEIYLNNFSSDPAHPEFNGFFLSSGSGVFWGNAFPAGYEYMVTEHNVRSDNADYSQTATPGGWGYCGTAFNGTGSCWDQNTSSSTGYACLDQPGRGQGQLLSGSTPTVINTSTGTCAWPNQTLEPWYEWMDTFTRVSGYCAPTSANAQCAWAVTEGAAVESANQDYYLGCNAASPTGCTSFSGAATVGDTTTGGVGWGLLAARPSTCTPKVGYWATDMNTLYQCSSTNTWTTYYTPYTYPHPLTQGSGGGA